MNAATADRERGSEPAASGTPQVDVPGAVSRWPPAMARRHSTHPGAVGLRAIPRASRSAIGSGVSPPIRSKTPERLDLSVVPAVRLPKQR